LLLIFGSAFIIFKTDIFYVNEINVENNYELEDKYIIERSEITENDNIFLLNIKNIERNLKKEVYIKDVNIKRIFPDKIVIDVLERTGRIKYSDNKKNLLLDFDGIVLKKIEEERDLILINSEIDVEKNPGEKVEFDKLNIKFNKILNLTKYIYENNETLNYSILMKKNNIYCIIDNDTYIKLDLEESLEYQYEFGLDIIEKRENNGESVNGVIDFTKGDNPIYVNFKDLEDNI
jgi:cell division septal protein FtsQ